MPTNSACQCHTTVLWMSNELLHELCASAMLMMEFHGTALSASNHLSRENQGEQRAAIQLNFSDKSVPELPNSYALIHPVELGKQSCVCT